MIHTMSTGNTRDATGEAERKEKFKRERDNKSSSIANCL